jgi:ribonuclease VapC
MIAVDTSALMAIALGEAEADACIGILAAEPEIVISAGTVAEALIVAARRWGKGADPAGLNFGDCFSYEVAKEHSCPLLYLGNDFSQTDIESALLGRSP